MNHQEAQRIAAAINHLRPEWSTGLLMTVLGDERMIRRPYADAAIVLTACAVDPSTEKPGRVHERGTWWDTITARGSAPYIRYGAEDDCAECNGPKDGPHVDHDWRPKLPPSEWARPTPEQKEVIRLETERLLAQRQLERDAETAAAEHAEREHPELPEEAENETQPEGATP